MGALGMYTGPAVVAAALVAVVLFALWQAGRVSWQCMSCGRVRNVSALKAVFAPKNKGRKIFPCPHCGKKTPHRAVTRQKWL